MKLKDRVALITGAGSGIGKATALLMAKEGAKIVITARREERCKETVDEICAMGGDALALPGDVGDEHHVEDLVNKTVQHFGRLDIVVPNAGINGIVAPIEDITPEEWDKTQTINIRGTFLTVKYSIPHLRQAGGGSIVIISSVNGNRIFSNFGLTAYSCSKAAQVVFAKMAALELAQWKIRVNVVCPGWTITNIGESSLHRNLDKIKLPVEFPDGKIPLENRGGTADELAETILFLASDSSSYTTGTEIYVDGALSLFQG